MGFIKSRDGRAENFFLLNLIKVVQTLETCCWWNIAISRLFYRQMCLRVLWKDAAWDAKTDLSLLRVSQGSKTYGNIEESVDSERPVHSDMGKHKPREPSDALAAHLCSEIAQGRVKLDPHLVVFHWFFACGGTIKGGGNSLGRRYCW